MGQASVIASIILAAGHGTRMKSAVPKVLHRVGGLPMLHHVMSSAQTLGAVQQVVVIGSQAPQVGDAAKAFDADVAVAVQDPPQGTGDAVRVAMPALEGLADEAIALILYADTPLVSDATISALVEAVHAGADMAVLGFDAADPGAYGRLVANAAGDLDRIVEAKEASPDELAITLCNSGVMALRLTALRAYLPKIDNNNAKGEYYLTDLAELITTAGGRAAIVTGTEDEVFGVNHRGELAEAERIFQRRRREAAMADGITLIDPDTVYFAHDTAIAPDTIIGPNVVFGPGVRITGAARIEAFSHLEGCDIAAGASVGPFARLRPGASLGEAAKVGNFVEIKKTSLGDGAKVSHLTYLGDAVVGTDANIGAGTITCNYDGYSKFVTTIGAGAFVGSNSSLVAPVTIGEGAYVGSGSVVTKDVADNALAVARGRQMEKADWAIAFRARQSKGGGH